MSNTVTLYKIQNRDPFIGYDIFHVYAKNFNAIDPYKQTLIDTTTHVLPEGFSFNQSECGSWYIYNKNNKFCQLLTDDAGNPYILDHNLHKINL